MVSRSSVALTALAFGCLPLFASVCALADDNVRLSAQDILNTYLTTTVAQNASEPATAPAVSVPLFSRIVIEPKGASRLEGTGTPGSKVVLSEGDKTLGTALVESDGRWLVTLREGLAPGEHRITSGVAANGNGKILAGDDVRIAVPEDLQGAAVVAYEARPAAKAEPTVRERAEELGKAANGRFNEIAPQAASPARPVPAQPEKKFDGRLAQQPSPPSTAPAEGKPESSSGGITAPVIEWLRRSAREYNSTVIRELSVPAPGTTAPRETETAGDKPVMPAPAAKPEEDPARKLVEERRKAEEAVRLKREAEEQKRLAAEKARKDAEAKKAAEEVARRQKQYDEEIARGLKELEQAKKETDAKTAEEAKRIAEEAARKEAARKVAEEQAKKDAEEDRLAEEQAKKDREFTEAQEDGPAPLGVKPQPETFGDAVAQEQQRAIEDEQGLPVIEDDSDLMETSDDEPRQSVRPSSRHKHARRKDASRTRGWRGRAHAHARCHWGRLIWRHGRRYYVVGPRDTLWSISRRYCGSGLDYTTIYNANRHKLSDPDVIRACMRLRIPKKC
jgi:nucleoid-associated protein YgaU